MRPSDAIFSKLKNIFAVAAADGLITKEDKKIFTEFVHELGLSNGSSNQSYIFSNLAGNAIIHEGQDTIIEDFDYQTYRLYIPENKEEKSDILRGMLWMMFSGTEITRPAYEVCQRYSYEADLSQDEFIEIFDEISNGEFSTMEDLKNLEKDIWMDKDLNHLRLLDQACIKDDLGKLVEAIELLNVIIHENKDEEVLKLSFNNRAFYKYRMKQYPTALSDVAKALEIDPQYALAIHTKAEILFDIEEYDAALSCMEEVMYLEPDNQAARDFWEKILEKMGR